MAGCGAEFDDGVLVTGGAGFIGSHTVERLLGRGCRVRVLDNLSTGKRKNLPLEHPELELMVGDITNSDDVRVAMQGMQRCLHLAAQVSVDRSIQDPAFSCQQNILGFVNILSAASHQNIKRLVYASSAAVYGNPQSLPIEESAVLAPISPYGLEKQVDEQYARLFGQLHGLSHFGVRYFNVYGPRQDPSSHYAGVISIFVARMQRGRGRVRLKMAMSLDGRTAMASGESQWITGPSARRDVQRLRAASCAIITGVGTVLADDCALTVRADDLGLAAEQTASATLVPPLRVVLDSALRTPAGARVLAGAAPTLVCHAESVPVPEGLVQTGASFQALPVAAQGLALAPLMAQLTARQCNEILVESGPRLAGALLQAGLVDELIVYMAPTLLGSTARPLLELPIAHMSEKVPLELKDARRVGQDWRFTMAPV